MAGSNYVAYNIAQTRTDAEKLQARNNIGSAALASLAESFESRAPSYVWSAGEVCTYGGKLWMFDANHSGDWTGADAHEVNVVEYIIISAPFKFKRYPLKVKSSYLSKFSHDSDNYIYDTNLQYRSLALMLDMTRKTACINGWFQCISSLYIDPNQGYTNIFECTLDINAGNWSFRTLFFNKSDNKLYPAFVVVNGTSVNVGFANSIAVSYIDVFDMMAAF